MKVVVGGLDLADAVGKVIKAASSRSLNHILEGIKLKAANDELVLTGTDLELIIEIRIKAEITKEGETVVPGRFFADYIKKMTSGSIELALNDNRIMTIKYQDSSSTIKCMNEDEYPPIKTIDSAESFEIEQIAFKDFISKIVFCAATDDVRPVLKGCLLDIQDGMLSGVALDGFRLGKCAKRITNSTANMTAVVPARSLIEMQKLLSDTEDKIKFYKHRNYVMLEINNTKIISKLLDGDFVNYNVLIPREFSTQITISKKQMEESLDRASLLSRTDKNNLVKFNIDENIMHITSESDLGKIEEKLIIKLDGKDLLIAFNVRYFIEILRAINDEFIRLKFNRPEMPCILTAPSDENEFLYLVLPIRIMK